MAKSEKATFKSYLSQQQIDMQRTFKSYVEDVDHQRSPQKTKSRGSKAPLTATSFFQTYEDPAILPGERIIAQAENVLRFSSFTEKKQGMSGALYVTNFKITFITAERSALNSTQAYEQRQRNRLIGDMDIPLTSIDTIYQGFSGGKRKKIIPGSTISNKTKYLYVHCQNLRLHQFSFKFTPKDQDKQIMNAIVAFAFPNRPELLFALQYGQQAKYKDTSGNKVTPTFDEQRDYIREVDRLGARGWVAPPVNALYSMSTSLPEYFLIPETLSVYDMREMAKHYVDNRVPIWCYTHTNGASLVRMAYLTSDADHNEHEHKYIVALSSLSPCGRPPAIYDLNKLCPTTRDLQHNFDKLKDLIIIDSVKEFWSSDVTWLTSLENTHWLSAVHVCLDVASQIVDDITERAVSVVIKEVNSRELCCVVSCLVQLMSDPHCRTIDGLQSLIQREWVAAGHPFQTHHNVIKYDHGHQSPVFLHFLDCVWQLTQQFVTSFEFTDTYLVSLWDSVHLGLFDNFLFDSLHQRDRFCGKLQQGPTYAVTLPNVWDWTLQYDSDDIALFKNPLFYLDNSRYAKVHKLNSLSNKMPNKSPNKSPMTPRDVKNRSRDKNSPDDKNNEADKNRLGVSDKNNDTNNTYNQNTDENTTDEKRDKNTDNNLTNGKTEYNSNAYDYALKLNTVNNTLLCAKHDAATGVTGLQFPCDDIILHPASNLSSLKLWRLCYLRWLAPGEIVNGGSQSGYLQQCLLIEEIVNLRHKVERLSNGSASSRPQSDLIFGQNNADKSALLHSSMITSSFPYSPASPRGQQSFVFMPLISYLNQSSISYDYTDADD